MPLTPTNMRVVDVARLLNSTSQGFVLAQARLYRQFNRVGFRIAATENTRNINLIKYIAWLCDERHTPAEEFVSTARSYEERKEAAGNAARSGYGFCPGRLRRRCSQQSPRFLWRCFQPA